MNNTTRYYYTNSFAHKIYLNIVSWGHIGKFVFVDTIAPKIERLSLYWKDITVEETNIINGKPEISLRSLLSEDIKEQVLTLPVRLASLNRENQEFVIEVLQKFINDAVTKYIKGQEEHGGNLWDRNCLAEMRPEIIDLMFYHAAEVKKRETKNENIQPS